MDNEIELSGPFFDAGGRESDREPYVELELCGIEIIQQAFQFGLVDGTSLVIGAETFVRVIRVVFPPAGGRSDSKKGRDRLTLLLCVCRSVHYRQIDFCPQFDFNVLFRLVFRLLRASLTDSRNSFPGLKKGSFFDFATTFSPVFGFLL